MSAVRLAASLDENQRLIGRALGFAPEFQRNGILWDYYIRAEA
jgi:hypothetical protein